MKTWCAVAAALVFLVLAVPTGLDSCGIAPPSPVFSARRRPANIEGEFLKGKVGVVQGTWQRRHLIAAFRILSGTPLTDEESESLYSALPAGNPYYGAAAEWLKVRSQIPGVNQAHYFDIYKSHNRQGQIAYFPNCLEKAFLAASSRLAEHRAQWGEADPRTLAWLQAQDQVFANCSGEKPSIPAPLPPDADPLPAADRAYQIAAACFYAGDWEKAREGFRRIAEDSTSPWRGIAPYLVARAFIREGILDGKPDALVEARSQLNTILSDESRRDWHEDSTRLLDYVRIHLDPNGRLSELSAALLKPDAGGDFGQTASDFLYLYNRYQNSDPAKQTDELASWLSTIEHGSPQPHRAVEQWRSTKNPAWLIAALQTAAGENLPELIRATRAVAPDAPAYESVTWFGIEKEIEAGHKDEARAWADKALAGNLLLSTRNLVLGARLGLSRDFTEFLRFAPRRPESHLEEYDGSERDVDVASVPTGDVPLFDADGLGVFNHSLPLSLWIEAAQSPLLPGHLQMQVAQAGWVRAVTLNRGMEARRLMARVVALEPKWKEHASAPPLLLMLHTPALKPHLAGGVADLAKPSMSGAGQWGLGANCWDTDPAQSTPNEPFLTPEQTAEAAKEHWALADSATAGATWLARRTVEWARANRDDPRVPEALHLAVQATRRGCRDEQTGNFSKQAFDLLHQRYPKSEWTAQTKYWYK